MAGPAMPPPSGKKGGLLKNLTPKQKKIAAVAGVGALLALIFLLSRSRSAPEEAQAGEGQPREGEAFSVPGGAGGATDPSAFLGQQSEVIGSRLEEVSGSLQEVGSGLGEVGQGQNELLRSQEELGGAVMAGQESDADAFGRVQAGLARQNRQLKAIRERLKHKGQRGKGSGNAKHKGKQHGKAHGKPHKKRHPKRGHGKPKKHPKRRRH